VSPPAPHQRVVQMTLKIMNRISQAPPVCEHRTGIAPCFLARARFGDRERGDACQPGDGEEVLYEAQQSHVPNEWDVEVVPREGRTPRVDRREDEEAHIVKKCAMPGSTTSAAGFARNLFEWVVMRLPRWSLRLFSGLVLLPGADQVRQPQHALGGERPARPPLAQDRRRA